MLRRFVVAVASEAAVGEPPDTVQGRRRAEEAYRRLIAGGAGEKRLVGFIHSGLQPVAPGHARIMLLRIN